MERFEDLTLKELSEHCIKVNDCDFCKYNEDCKLIQVDSDCLQLPNWWKFI